MAIENFPSLRRTLYAGVGFEAVLAFSARQNRVHVLAGNDKKALRKNFLSALLLAQKEGFEYSDTHKML